MKKQKILAYEGRIPVSDRELTAAVIDIDNKKHLIIDLYIAGTIKYRMAVNDKEYAHFNYENQKWDCISTCWNRPYSGELSKASIDRVDKQLLKEWYAKEIPADWDNEDLIYAIEQKAFDIKTSERMLKEENEKEKLFAIMPQKPKFLDETINRYIEAGNIIYYKRKGSYADYYCCQCGEKFTRRIKATEAYAGPSVDIVPRRYQSKECPKCKRKGTLLNWGRAKITKQEFEVLLYQAAEDETLVIRAYAVRAVRSPGSVLTKKIWEYGREFLRRDYERIYDNICNTGKWWKSKKLDIYRSGKLCEVNYSEAVEKSDLRYIPATAYKLISEVGAREERHILARYDTLTAYAHAPQIEQLYKIGLMQICRRLIFANGQTRDINKKAKTAAGILRITTEQLRYLRESEQELLALSVIKIMNYRKIPFTQHNAEIVTRLYIAAPTEDKLKHILKYQSPEKLLNYLNKNIPEHAILADAITEYDDYLRAREANGDDLSNTVYLGPRELHKTYIELREKMERAKSAKYVKQMNEKYAKIKVNSAKVTTKYTWQQSGLLIRPARDAGEVVMEGRILHHCVGDDHQRYLSNYNQNKAIILVIRHENEPDKPYITVEYENNKVQQWYGIRDTKPDKETIDSFLKAYVAHIAGKAGKAG